MSASHVVVGTQTQLVLNQVPSTKVREQQVTKSLMGVEALLVRGPSLIKINILEDWLLAYPHKEDAAYLCQGFRYGFGISALGERKASMAKNL